MQADDCPDGVLQPILDRLSLPSLASPSFYRRTAHHIGMKEVHYEDLSQQLANHYSRILNKSEEQTAQALKDVSADYLKRMRKGLRHWIDGGEKRYLAWGIFHFRKL
jgi:sarcosine/dimethylglycine N-methyltransferase